jgi:phenylpropionate dioxygenase-like ring-hydroxylating dioxygenase large terminal subunit
VAVIANQWYVVLESHEVKRGKPVGMLRMGEKLVFWRDSQGKLSCLRDLCAHRGAALSAGAVLDDCIQCPFHGIRYDATGRGRLIPANGKDAPVPERFRVHAYPTHEAHGLIWIWWGETPPADLAPPPFFADIDASFIYASVHDPWATHYSRAIENQLDVVHLPFVHYNTIGRGNRTLVNGPVTEWINDDLLFLYVYNQVDVGQKPRRAEEIAGPHGPFHIEFQFPNLWQNYLSEQARIVVAFVPVDDEHTMMYLRFYQKFLRWPLLRHVFTRLATPSNLYILHQDRRVVTTQRPQRSDLRLDEKLIQGDRPIVEYRRRRQALLNAAASQKGQDGKA